jgi:hypothetical protein
VIGGVLDTLGSRVAERWASVVTPLGLLFVAATWIGLVLGQAHGLDGAMLVDRSAERFGDWGDGSTGTLIVAVVVLVAATAASFLAEQAGALVERWWLAAGPSWWVRLSRDGRLGRWRLAKGRRGRWREADAAYRAAVDGTADSPADLRSLRGQLASRRNRIALSEPQRPTWIGDRLRVAGERVHHQYGLDLEAAWPRLWLVLPDAAREELRAARAELAAAARLCGWGVLFAVLGVALWWPALLAAAVLAAKGWREGRAGAETLASLVEASFDVHLSALVAALRPADGPLPPAIGREITEQLRKGA